MLNIVTSFLAARIVFAVPFAVFGFNHLAGSAEMASYMLPGWPAAQALVIISGLAMIAGAAAITIGKQAVYASLGIAVLMLVFIVTLHIPALIAAGGDKMKMMMPMVSMFKDTGLMGGALALAHIFHHEK